MLKSLCAGVALSLGMLGATQVSTALGQDLPDLSSDFLDRQTLIDGDTIRFCVYEDSAIGAYDRRVAQALGDSLFLEVKIVEVEPPITVQGLDTIPISLDDLFILLTNECDAFMGMELAPEVYPVWLTLTRAYFSAPYIGVVREGEYASLEQLPEQARVATQTLTTGDMTFNTWRQNQPESTRLRRIPYPTTSLQLERLRDMSVDAAIVWRPWLEQPEADISGIAVVPNGMIPLSERNMAIAVRSRDSFLRSSLDEAIAHLESDGTLAEIYQETYSVLDAPTQ